MLAMWCPSSLSQEKDIGGFPTYLKVYLVPSQTLVQQPIGTNLLHLQSCTDLTHSLQHSKIDFSSRAKDRSPSVARQEPSGRRFDEDRSLVLGPRQEGKKGRRDGNPSRIH